MPVHPAPRAAAQPMSLMSIVEGVSRANRDGWAGRNNSENGGSAVASGSGSGSGLVEVKAPRPDAGTVRERTMSAGTVEGLPRAPGSLFLTSGSAYSTPAVPSTFLGPPESSGTSTSSASSSLKRPATSPLRSAMRSVSPPPVPAKAPVPTAAPVPAVPVPIPAPAPVLNGTVNENGKGKGKAIESEGQGDGAGTGDDSDDAASISSYETGHETLNDDGDETETEREEDHEKPPPPPPHEYGNGTVLHDSPVQANNLIEDYGYGGSDLSASSASTQTGAPSGAPKRRKSVRVSLQPTFSPTPPAIDYETEEEADQGRHAPWNGRAQPPDMWEDSSEEDVEYQKAKKLLTRVSRKEKKNR
ncbi:hypothetical protein C8R47DRAFT_1125246 [Mycena vitilis]|nr:hypothetical protein C8R47DRAFT_1125246 [Mycena vitilis]